MKHFINDLPAFAIVVKDNTASEFYFNKIIPAWNSIDIHPQRYDAVTPETLPDGPLRFDRNKLSKYRKIHPAGKSFTPTEKAVWYSHYFLWKKCIEMDTRILVLEHDCVPIHTEKLWYKDEHSFKSFDKGALGCYMVSPRLAKMATGHLENGYGIALGPLGTLVDFVYRVERDPHNKHWNLIEGVDGRYDPGCTQIIHSHFKTTIQHIEGTEVEHQLKDRHGFQYYINIDDLADPLTIDVLKANCKRLHG